LLQSLSTDGRVTSVRIEEKMAKIGIGIVSTIAAGCALALVCMHTKPAHADPKDSNLTWYYSDDTYKTVVGEGIVSCNPPFYTLLGEETLYSKTTNVEECY
jgi:hypothetical protein